MKSQLAVPRVVVRDTALTYGSSVLVGGLQFLILVVLTRRLGKPDVGVIVLSTAISGTIATAAEFGVGPLIATHYQTLPTEDPFLWAALVRLVARLMMSLTAAGVIVGVVAATVLNLGVADGRTADAVGFGVTTGAISVAAGYVQTFLVAQKQFTRLAAASGLTAAVRLAAVIGLALIHRIGVTSVLAVYLLSVIFSILVVAPWLPRPWVPARQGREPSNRASALAKSMIGWVLVSRAAAVVTGRLDVLLLSAFVSSAAVATYAAGYQPATVILMFGIAAGAVALPHLAGELGRERANRIIRRWVRWLAPFSVAALAAAAAGYELLPTVFGPSYAGARPVFGILVFAFAMQAWIQPIASLLYALGRSRDVALLSGLYMVAAIVFETGLIITAGAVGAALGVFASSVIGVVVALRLAVRAVRPC